MQPGVHRIREETGAGNGIGLYGLAGAVAGAVAGHSFT